DARDRSLDGGDAGTRDRQVRPASEAAVDAVAERADHDAVALGGEYSRLPVARPGALDADPRPVRRVDHDGPGGGAMRTDPEGRGRPERYGESRRRIGGVAPPILRDHAQAAPILGRSRAEHEIADGTAQSGHFGIAQERDPRG